MAMGNPVTYGRVGNGLPTVPQVAEIKRAVFRALTRLRAATIKAGFPGILQGWWNLQFPQENADEQMIKTYWRLKTNKT